MSSELKLKKLDPIPEEEIDEANKKEDTNNVIQSIISSSNTHFNCEDENCTLLHLARQICNSPKRIYSLFVVSLLPFRYVIARRHDGEFHNNLNHEFSTLIKQGIFILRDIFSEWYDIIHDYDTNFSFICYYHNIDLDINGFFDIFTGNTYIYQYSKIKKNWNTQIWNVYSCVILYDDINHTYILNDNLINICENIANKYNYTTIRMELDEKSHIITQTS